MDGIMNGFFEGEMERVRVNELEKRLKSARVLGKTNCVKCGHCCNKRTCIPTPNELKKIAKFLKLTTKELIDKYYAIDTGYITDGIYYVKPLGENIKDLGGKFIPNSRTFDEGKCIFLTKNNLCKIYSVRTQSAKGMECWNKQVNSDGDKKRLVIAWDGKLKKEFKINGAKLQSGCDED